MCLHHASPVFQPYTGKSHTQPRCYILQLAKSNFRVRLLLGCHGLESDATRFRARRDGRIDDLEAQAFLIQFITDLKQNRSELLINQP